MVNQETIDFLMENLHDAHAIFNTIIHEMQAANIPYEYEFLRQKEQNSYESISNNILKMNSCLYEYDYLKDTNEEFFDYENHIYFKYIILYIVSIVFIRVYHEIFNIERFNEFWHYLVGLFLGSTYIGLLNKDLNEHRGGTKEKRYLINRVKSLKEDYKSSHDNAVVEIDYIFALNDNLWDELDKGKKLVKNK